MNKKGFTLIELLAVIIILGILMLIAIPSVTGYINNSRKETYVSTIKELIKGASNLVNEGKVDIYDKNTTYYIPVSAIELESGVAQSPFGDIDEAYVVVTYDGEEYEYYYVGKDKANAGIESLKKEENITYKDIDTDVDDIDNEVGVDNRKYVKVFNEDLKSLEKSIEATKNIDSDTNEEYKIVCKRAKSLHTLTCNSNGCRNAGYEDGEHFTVGNLGNEGFYEPGDAFNCDVNKDGRFNDKDERFYYLHDDYDTGVLISANIVWQNGTIYTFGRSVYNREQYNNWKGPVSTLESLPSTDVWKNVSLKNSKRQILNEYHEKYTRYNTLPVFDYGDKAARLLSLEEFQNACGLPNDSNLTAYDARKCLYIFEHTAFSTYAADCPWLENVYSNDNIYSLYLNCYRNEVSYTHAYMDYANVKPVIEVPLKKIEQ